MFTLTPEDLIALKGTLLIGLLLIALIVLFYLAFHDTNFGQGPDVEGNKWPW